MCKCKLNESDPLAEPSKHEKNCPSRKVYLRTLLVNAGVTKRTIETLENPKKTKAIVAVDKYLANGFKNGNALVLAGGTGVGKTVAIGYFISLASGKKVYAADLTKIFLNDSEFYRLKHTKILCIDDLGVEYRQDFFCSNLDSLINYRHGEHLPTLIATNLTAKAFKETYSERIFSRLKEWGSFVNILDKDMRVGE